MRLILAALPLFLLAAPAYAGDLQLTLTDDAGRPVADAVVTVVPAGGVPKGPISFPWGTTMVQQDISFAPHVLIVPVGATVRFPNKDKVRHHIYSFSKAARFEVKLFGRDETRSYMFNSPGAVALGCNIHDSMSAFIRVVDTPFAAKSNAAGQVRINGVPAGASRVIVWHERLRTKDNEVATTMPIAATGTLARPIKLALRSRR